MGTAAARYEIIRAITSNDDNVLHITWLCEVAQVSRSGYYNWLSNENKRIEKEKQDEEDFKLILQAYQFRGYNKGSRGIHMRLLHMGITMNRKKIQRLMRKYNLVCPIRKANPYKRMAKATEVSSIADNLVSRKFRQAPRKIILTDITYLFHGREYKKVYLSVMKDAYTNEILAYVLSKSLKVDFVIETMEQLIRKHGETLIIGKNKEIDINDVTIIHSDQGSHYKSTKFREFFENDELRQSMSRKANCWDNAPQESFFGHMKDEIGDYVRACQTFKGLQRIIDDYMDYYNNDRYQWNLEKLSPKEYYEYCITGIHPLGLEAKDLETKDDDTTEE